MSSSLAFDYQSSSAPNLSLSPPSLFRRALASVDIEALFDDIENDDVEAVKRAIDKGFDPETHTVRVPLCHVVVRDLCARFVCVCVCVCVCVGWGWGCWICVCVCYHASIPSASIFVFLLLAHSRTCSTRTRTHIHHTHTHTLSLSLASL